MGYSRRHPRGPPSTDRCSDVTPHFPILDGYARSLDLHPLGEHTAHCFETTGCGAAVAAGSNGTFAAGIHYGTYGETGLSLLSLLMVASQTTSDTCQQDLSRVHLF